MPADLDLHRRGLGGIAPGGVLRGRYQLRECLGQGAHGISYYAEHIYLGFPCVVKLLPLGTSESSDATLARLRAEARAGYRVCDPRVVRVLDCDAVRGTWYFVMEYVEGVDLARPLDDGQRLPWQQAVQVAVDAALGLHAIHAARLLHRDVKPGNLLLGCDGRTRVADLGVARLAVDRREPNQRGGPEMVGTLTYTAPEMFLSGATIGPAADLYSLGASLYHLLNGRPPHEATQVFRRLIDLQTRPVTWPADGADVPDWLVQATLKLLAIEPAERFASARDLLCALRDGGAAVELPAAGTATLEPRGVGILPLQNERQTPADDWLGQAVANYLWRGLSETPGIYVAAQETIVSIANRLGLDLDGARPARLLDAGRMVGAATLITGRFSNEGDTLHVALEMLRPGQAAPVPLSDERCPIDQLSTLGRRLLNAVRAALAIHASAPTAGGFAARSPVLRAQESFVLASQAYRRGEYDDAVTFAQDAVRLDPEFAEAVGFIGVCLARVGRYPEAEAQHLQQRELADQWGDARLRVEACANLGVMNYFRGTYEQAVEQLTQAAATAAEHHLATEHAQICNNLGFVLLRMGKHAEAEQAFVDAIETHRAFGALASLMGPYNGAGNVLVEQGRFAGARGYYRQSLAIAEEIGDRISAGMTHTHLGRCAALEECFAEAQHEFTMALNALEETRFWNGLARAYEYIADMNLRLGNLDEAVRCSEQRIELARQHDNARMESAAWQQKADALERLGRHAEAEQCRTQGSAVEAATKV